MVSGRLCKNFPSSQGIVTDKGQICTCRNMFNPLQHVYRMRQLLANATNLYMAMLLSVNETTTSRLCSIIVHLFNDGLTAKLNVSQNFFHPFEIINLVFYFSKCALQRLAWHSIFRISLKNHLLFKCLSSTRVNHILILI